jgi:hypothetical protein
VNDASAHLYSTRRDLPDEAQKAISEVPTIPDFYYSGMRSASRRVSAFAVQPIAALPGVAAPPARLQSAAGASAAMAARSSLPAAPFPGLALEFAYRRSSLANRTDPAPCAPLPDIRSPWPAASRRFRAGE